MLRTRPVFRLLWPLVGSARNRVREYPRATLVVGLVALLVLVGLEQLLEAFLWKLQEVPIGGMLIHHLMSMFLFSLQWLLGFSTVINALGAFFLSLDHECVRSSPVPEGEQFWARYLETSLTSAWMVWLLLVPVLFAYGNVLAAPPLFFLVMPLLPLPYLFLVTAAATSFALLLAWMLPVRRTRDLMRFFSVAGMAVLILLFRTLKPERLTESGGFDKLASYLVQLHPQELEAFPSYWLTEINYSFLRGDFEFLFPTFVAKLLGALGVAWILARVVFGWVYQDAFFAFQEAPPPEPKGPGWVSELLLAPLRLLPERVAQQVLKDARIMARSTVVWTQLSLMGVIVVIYAYNLVLLPAEQLKAIEPGFPAKIAFANIAFLGFLIVAAALRFGFPTVSLEGEAFLVVHASPLGMRRFLEGKLILNGIPLLTLALVLAGLAHFLLTPPLALSLLAGVDAIVLAGTVTALALAFSALFRNLRAASFAHLPSGPGGVAFLIAAMAYVLVFVGMQWPSFQVMKAWSYPELFEPPRQFLGAILGGGGSLVLSGVVTVGSLRVALKSLEGGLE